MTVPTNLKIAIDLFSTCLFSFIASAKNKCSGKILRPLPMPIAGGRPSISSAVVVISASVPAVRDEISNHRRFPVSP